MGTILIIILVLLLIGALPTWDRVVAGGVAPAVSWVWYWLLCWRSF